MNKKAKLLAVASVCGLVVTVLGASSAQADPSGAPTFRQLAGVGSDVTSPVMNALSNTITIGGTKVIGSYDAIGSTTIATQSAAACSAIARPNGSNAGRAALIASLEANNGCLQFARSSSLTTTATGGPQLTYVPFATDAVSFAVTNTSTVPRVLALSDLQQIYQCNPAYVGTGPNYTIAPLIPQPGSGTRSFWETEMGITDAQVTNGSLPCITDLDSHGNLIEEDNGLVLGNNNLIPFPVSAWDAQEAETIPDVRGQSILGVIDGFGAQAINPSFDVTRSVYNVIPTASENTAPWSTVFNGPGSLICTNTAIIEEYGFEQNANCGSTTTVTSP